MATYPPFKSGSWYEPLRTYIIESVSEAVTALETAVNTALGGKAASVHTHAQSQVTGLSTALTGKADAGHLHTSAQVTDFVEAVQDAVGSLLGAGSNITLTYSDETNALTINAVGDGTGMDPEAVRDAIGVALVGVGNIAVVVNDAADTITISTTATTNATDAALRDRSSHTGSQGMETITGLEAALDAKADGPGILLIENGASVPPGTPAGTVIFEKA